MGMNSRRDEVFEWLESDPGTDVVADCILALEEKCVRLANLLAARSIQGTLEYSEEE